MTTANSSAGLILLAPGDRFFLQPVTLDAGAPAGGQVELALEEVSPFPLPQLYHGFVTDSGGSRALAFAAYRRRLPVEEQAAWPEAVAVLPDFLALLGPAPGEAAVVVHVDGGIARAAAWNGHARVPAALIARALPEAADAAVAELVAELRPAAGPGDVPVRHLSGPIEARMTDDGAVAFTIGGQETFRLPAAGLADADVRDKSFLGEKGRRERLDRRWWGAAIAAAGLLVLALGLELANLGLGLWTGRERAAVGLHADDVRRIEAAQTMAMRIEHLAARQQRPLEWLGTVSAVRPRSVQFIRASGKNDRTLEIEAQTANANDVGNYEAELRRVPAVQSVETRDLRAREGLTTFVVALTFKPAEAGRAEGRP